MPNPKKKPEWMKEFKPLFERMSKADISLNESAFYKLLQKTINKEVKKARLEMLKKIKYGLSKIDLIRIKKELERRK